MADEDSSQLNCEEEEMGAAGHSSCFYFAVPRWSACSNQLDQDVLPVLVQLINQLMTINRLLPA